MRINGIGTVKKEEAMKILTTEGKRAVKAGEISTEDLGEMYKLEMVKRASLIGSCLLYTSSYRIYPLSVIQDPRSCYIKRGRERNHISQSE